MSALPGASTAGIPVPLYGSASLADVVPSVLASVATPGFTDVLGLPSAAAACVLLVDGLGATLVREHADDAPVLHAALNAGGRDLTTGFPSTTAASVASIGTGRTPGEHGVVGYQVAIPGAGRLMNSLRWDPAVDPMQWQPAATAFERAIAAGTPVVQVAKREFESSGLTRAALRGGRFAGADSFGEVAAGSLAELRRAVEARQRTLVYAYIADLDATGHPHGVGSQAWRFQLQLVDRMVEQIASALPAGSRLYVTADHGMLDVPVDRRVDAETEQELLAGVDLFGGEARARYLYVEPGATDDVVAAWRARLGADAVVCTREEAIDAGWFGRVSDLARPRIGDVIVASLSDIAIVCSKSHPREAKLIGHHGSVTPAERLVPLIPFGDD